MSEPWPDELRLAADGAALNVRFDTGEQVALPAEAGSSSRRLYVVRGDNLWNIARAHYGDGWRYTTIFNANKGQIRDPDLIYPGQIFSLPKTD